MLIYYNQKLFIKQIVIASPKDVAISYNRLLLEDKVRDSQ